MPSMPTASRTKPGAHAGCQLLLGAELGVGGRRRMDHQRPHVADIGDVAVQFQRVDERLPGLHATGQLEGKNGSGSLGRQLLSQLIPRRAGQPRIVDRKYAVVVGQEFGDPLRVGDMPLDSQAQGFQTLRNQERVER